MRKVIALTVCFGFLLLAIPSLNAAPKKAPKINIIQKTVIFINSMLPNMPHSFIVKDFIKFKKFGKRAKITGTLDSDRISRSAGTLDSDRISGGD